VGELLQTLAKKQNKAVVVVTHDLRLKDYVDKIYQILDGKMELQPTKQTLNSKQFEFFFKLIVDKVHQPIIMDFVH